MTIKDKQTQAFQDRCRALRPIIGKQADQFWMAYLFQDEEGREELEEQLNLLVNANLNTDVQNITPIFHPPSQQDAQGEVVMGWVHYNGKDMCPFGLKPLELAQHTSIVGRTGSGKSNAGYLLAMNLAKAGIPCNAVAAFHHDHLFIPVDRADDAFSLLEALSQSSAPAAI